MNLPGIVKIQTMLGFFFCLSHDLPQNRLSKSERFRHRLARPHPETLDAE